MLIGPADLTNFADIPEAKAATMCADVEARTRPIAPCLFADEVDPEVAAAAKAILRGVVLRWHEAGQQAIASQQAGPFGMTLDTRQPRKSLFWPSEVRELQELCGSGAGHGGAFTVDAKPDGWPVALDAKEAFTTGG